jgi:hypothetical protein
MIDVGGIPDKPPVAVLGHPRRMKMCGHPADVAAFLVPRAR